MIKIISNSEMGVHGAQTRASSTSRRPAGGSSSDHVSTKSQDRLVRRTVWHKVVTMAEARLTTKAVMVAKVTAEALAPTAALVVASGEVEDSSRFY